MNTEAMTIDAVDASKRKLNMDPDDPNAVLPDPKRPRMAIDNTQRNIILTALMVTYLRLEDAIFKKHGNNLNTSCHIMNIISTCHNVERQKMNGTGGDLAKKVVGQTPTARNGDSQGSISIEQASKIVRDTFKEYGLEYNVKNVKDNWIGTMAPILVFFLAFNYRRDEIRLGTDELIVSTNNTELKVVKLKNYGIEPAHRPLCEGMTYPPDKKSSIAQSLGPLTSLIMLKRSNAQFRTKWEIALQRALKLIPNSNDIIACIKNHSVHDLKNMITALANLLLIVSDRHSRRGFVPMVLLIDASLTKEDRDKIIAGEKLAVPDGLNLFDFSGRGLFFMYKLISKNKYTLNFNGTSAQAAQLAFHCLFGTHLSDLSILERITNTAKWFVRSEFGKSFTGNNAVEFTFPQLIYFAKLASANQTGLLASSNQQIISIPVFSGKVRQKPLDIFYEYMAEDSTQTNIGGRNPIQLANMLRQYTVGFVKQMKSEEGRTLGTVKWRLMEDIEKDTKGTEVDLIFEGNEKLFFNSRQQ